MDRRREINRTRTNALIKATFTASVKDAAGYQGIHSGQGAEQRFCSHRRPDGVNTTAGIYGEARGGHIPGAVQIPMPGFNSDKTVLSYADLKTLLETCGVTADKEVASNCTVGDPQRICLFCPEADVGYPSAANYDALHYRGLPRMKPRIRWTRWPTITCWCIRDGLR